MHKKDYLQRRLEEFGKALALILSHKHNSDWDSFEKEIAEATRRFTPLEIEHVELLSPEAFATDVLSNPDLAQEQKKILASLLFEKLSLYMARENEQNYLPLKAKCIALYTHLQENFTDNEFDLDVHYKLGFLNKL